jgi:hypothetical protein
MLLNEEAAVLEEIVATLASRYRVVPVDGPGLARLAGVLDTFKVLRGGQSLALVEARWLTARSGRALYCVVVLTQRVTGGGARGQADDRAIREAYQLVLADLPRDVGRVMIRPGRAGDRIGDWFGRRRVAFREHPEFERHYHLSAEDEDRVRQAFRWGFLEVVSRYRGLLIEIAGARLLVMNGRILNREDAGDLAEAALGMRNTLR